MSKSAGGILAATLGWDVAEVREHRYQSTRTSKLIFAIGDDYYMVTKTKPTWDGLDWHQHPDQFWAWQNGTILWVAKMNSEAK